MTRPPPISTLFPSPPLFRSVDGSKKTHRLFAGDPAVISGDADRRISDVHRKPERPSGSGAEQTRGICLRPLRHRDRKSTRLNSSHLVISYAVFCLKKKKTRA